MDSSTINDIISDHCSSNKTLEGNITSTDPEISGEIELEDNVKWDISLVLVYGSGIEVSLNGTSRVSKSTATIEDRN